MKKHFSTLTFALLTVASIGVQAQTHLSVAATAVPHAEIL